MVICENMIWFSEGIIVAIKDIGQSIYNEFSVSDMSAQICRGKIYRLNEKER
jgi:hypothetical protein